MTQFASHWAAAATASAVARILLLNISPSSTQTTGPQLMPKRHDVQVGGDQGDLAERAGRARRSVAGAGRRCEKQTAIVPSVSTMPAAPTSSSGLRPILSIRAIAMSVVTMLVTLVMTLISSALLSEKPTDCHSVVE